MQPLFEAPMVLEGFFADSGILVPYYNYTVEPQLSGLAISTKNGRVNSCYHGHTDRNVYLLRMFRRPYALQLIN